MWWLDAPHAPSVSRVVACPAALDQVSGSLLGAEPETPRPDNDKKMDQACFFEQRWQSHLQSLLDVPRIVPRQDTRTFCTKGKQKWSSLVNGSAVLLIETGVMCVQCLNNQLQFDTGEAFPQSLQTAPNVSIF